MCSISIIVPIFNAADYLSKCIESIYTFHLDNPDKAIELILVDDGSYDGSDKICNSYACEYINEEGFTVVVIHQINKGVSAARNAGLDAAHCEWIWFVDADDFVEPVKINVPDSDVIMFGAKIVEADDSCQFCGQDDCIGISKEHFLLNHYSFLNQTMWFKHELIQKYSVRFTGGMKMGEDLEFQFKCLMMCEKPCSSKDIIYNYRIVEGSATNNDKSRMNIVNDSVLLFDNLLNFIKEYNIKEQLWLSERLSRQMKTMLFSIGKIRRLILRSYQVVVRDIFDRYKRVQYTWMESVTMKLAYKSLFFYIILNRIYLLLKRK